MIQASPEPEQRVDLGGDGETVNSQEQPLVFLPIMVLAKPFSAHRPPH